MTYVIGQVCADVADRACVEERPADCIHPGECIDCGAREPVASAEAIYYQDDLPDHLAGYLVENAQFFGVTLDGRAANAPLVAALQPQGS